jgi:NitT/TauT family transport system permease protein
MAIDEREALAGLDALELASSEPPAGRRAWQVLWPKLGALAIVLGAWQAVVWSGWRPEYLLPGPIPVLRKLGEDLASGAIPQAFATTMGRALTGYALALLIGLAVGLAVAAVPPLRVAIGSLITGLQTMPSIAWFPLAIMLFGLQESAILFVVVIGAAPSIANGLLSGVDHVPPLLRRAGTVLGARGLALYRHVVLPAALPGLVAGLKQGWAFAWRSLMAGELLVIIAARPSLGTQLHFARELMNARALLASMLVILVIGVVVDGLVFGQLERRIRRNRGLTVG